MEAPVIDEIRLYKCGLGMDFTYSTRHMTYGSSIIWEIKSGGYVGFGEGACWSAEHWNVAQGVAQILLKKQSLQGEAIIPATLDRWELRPVREGLDIGLHDLIGKILGVPVHVLLGGKRRTEIPGMPVVHVAAAEVMARRAEKWVSAGYRYVKVKFRGEPTLDLEAIRAVRDSVGEEVDLQVDANSGYKSVQEVVSFINQMNDLHISIVEDPMHGSPEEYRKIREQIDPMLMIDGDAYWPSVFKIISSGSADIINHHPNNQGGLISALRIDAVAQSAGIPSAVGSCGLFGIQNTAFQILSSVIGLTRPCEDIGLLPYWNGPTEGEYDFSQEPSVLVQPFRQEKGTIWISDAPGLGIEVDRNKLSEVVEEEKVFR